MAIGRGFLANPELPKSIASGKLEDLKPCIGCGKCIGNQLIHENTIVCSVNPSVGQITKKYVIKPATKIKKLMIVGGGPAGMEAARIAAIRGHKVTLYEKETMLGGQLNQAIIPPYKKNLIPLIEYFRIQMEKSGIVCKTGIKVNSALIKRENPDVVILATGGIQDVPSIPGIEKSIVLPVKKVLNGIKVGKRIVILGGGLVGCETADFLANKGKKVSIIENLPKIAEKMVFTHKILLLERLKHFGVKIFASSKCLEIKDHSVVIENRENQIFSVKTDNVVIAIGVKPNIALQNQIDRFISEIYIIGDCYKPAGIAESIAAGYLAALHI